jgi:hypothetical protein
MEKQQEILFRIVSENKTQAGRQSYPPRTMGMGSMNFQIDPFLALSAEQPTEASNSSAFKPSKIVKVPTQGPKLHISPTAHQSQNNPEGFSTGFMGGNALSQVRLITEICSNLLSKQM